MAGDREKCVVTDGQELGTREGSALVSSMFARIAKCPVFRQDWKQICCGSHVSIACHMRRLVHSRPRQVGLQQVKRGIEESRNRPVIGISVGQPASDEEIMLGLCCMLRFCGQLTVLSNISSLI